MPVRILLVAHHGLMLHGLRAVLGQTDAGFDVVGDAKSCDEAVEKAISLSPNIAVIDTSFFDGDAGAMVRLIREKSPPTRVLVLAWKPETEHFRQALASGASGYELLDITASHLANAIRAVAAGKTAINGAVLKHVAEALVVRRSEMVRQPPRLTRREIEIVTRVGKGLGDKEIAAELMLSEATVKSHLRVVYTKLAVHNRAQAATFAVRCGLVSE